MYNTNQSKPPKIRVSEQYLEERPIRRSQFPRPPKRWIWILVAILGLIAALVALFLYFRAQSELKEIKKDLETTQSDPVTATRDANQQLIDQVGKLIILPRDEEPTIATVSDLEKLKGQAFFNKAQIGDKVLIYNKAQKAILYRPSENKIIELAPLINNSQNAN